MTGLSTDELDLLERTRKFVAQHVAPQAARRARERTSGAELGPLAAEVGLLGLQVPVAHGGRGMSFSCKAKVAEILAAGDFGVAMALINTHNVAEQLSRLADPGLAQRWIPALVSGRHSACTALTEPGAGSDLSAIQTRAVPVPGGWQLDGTKHWITNAVHADVVVVYAQTRADAGAAGIAAFLVEAGRAGFHRLTDGETGPVSTLGAGAFRLDGYRCTQDEMVSPPGDAFKDIMGSINGARTFVAAMCCGMVGEALSVASAFGKQRRTFGKSLLAHQGWRWQLADAVIDLEAAGLMVQAAATLIDAGKPSQGASARTKVFATRMAQRHIAALMHAMGAEGLGENRPFVRHLAAAQIAGLVDGSTEMLLERIAKDFKAA
jgi:alkylation response protein AidB-like acyl-CoA dehydrogenase